MKSEQSLFLQVLGNSPLIRVWDLLLEGREFDYSKRDISYSSNVSWNTLEKIWLSLVYRGFITKTRKIGKQELFKLNAENELVRMLIEFDDSLIKYSIESNKKVGKERSVKRQKAEIVARA